MIARVPSGFLLRPGPDSLEIRARQIVEEQVERLPEQRPHFLLHVALDPILVRQQSIETAIQPVGIELLHRHTCQVVESRLRIELLFDLQLARRCQ
jgi:hypothetical protein